MSDDGLTDALMVAPHPDAAAIVTRYPVGTVVHISDGQHFVVGHRGDIALVLVPITDASAEMLCSFADPITMPSSTN
jgi:hypothetical protein